MFEKIGNDRCINLVNVAQIYKRDYDMKPCIQIDFVGPDGLYERFYPGSKEHTALQTWIEEQPTLLNDERQQTGALVFFGQGLYTD